LGKTAGTVDWEQARTFGRPHNAARFSGFYPASTCGHATGGGFWPSGNQPERVSTNPRTN
jgi:hypothetical protein